MEDSYRLVARYWKERCEAAEAYNLAILNNMEQAQPSEFEAVKGAWVIAIMEYPENFYPDEV